MQWEEPEFLVLPVLWHKTLSTKPFVPDAVVVAVSSPASLGSLTLTSAGQHFAVISLQRFPASTRERVLRGIWFDGQEMWAQPWHAYTHTGFILFCQNKIIEHAEGCPPVFKSLQFFSSFFFPSIALYIDLYNVEPPKKRKQNREVPVCDCNLHNQTTTLTNPPGQRNLWLTCKHLQTRIHSAKTKTLAQWRWCLFSNIVLRRQSVLNPHAASTMWNVAWWCQCTPLLHYICICIAKSLAQIGPRAYATGSARRLLARFLRENFIPTDAFMCHTLWHDLSLPNCQKNVTLASKMRRALFFGAKSFGTNIESIQTQPIWSW